MNKKNHTDTQKEYEEITTVLTELRRKKSLAYGDSFLKTYDKYGEKALFFDLLRKWQRIENILMNDGINEVDDETVRDTLADLSVMCINGIIWMESNKNDI